jgi:hypothetical protein
MVLILGRPGVGKTRLAGTFPQPFFIDLESGADTAHPGEIRKMDIPTNADTLKTLKASIHKLGKNEFKDGALQTDVGPVQTLVVDSMDAVQQAVMDFSILKGNKYRMERQDWGTILNMVRPTLLMLRNLPVHVVVTAHTKTTEGDGRKLGIMDLAVQGALKAQMPRWFDIILHIAERPKAKRALVTQGTVWNQYRWLAKDRHNALRPLTGADGLVDLPADEDYYPSDDVAKAVIGVGN